MVQRKLDTHHRVVAAAFDVDTLTAAFVAAVAAPRRNKDLEKVVETKTQRESVPKVVVAAVAVAAAIVVAEFVVVGAIVVVVAQAMAPGSCTKANLKPQVIIYITEKKLTCC